MRRQLVWMVLRLADKVLLLGLRRGREGVAGAMGRSGALTNTVECRLLRMKKGLGGAVRRELVRRVLRLADKALLLLGLRRRREGIVRAMGRSGALTKIVERRLLRMKKGLGGTVRRELVRRVLRLADKALLLNLRWRRGEGVLRTVRWKRALADTAERRLLGLT